MSNGGWNQSDSVSVAIKPLFSMVSGCVRIENHRKYTEKYTGSCALFEKRRHAMNIHNIFTFHSVWNHGLKRMVSRLMVYMPLERV